MKKLLHRQQWSLHSVAFFSLTLFKNGTLMHLIRRPIDVVVRMCVWRILRLGSIPAKLA